MSESDVRETNGGSNGLAVAGVEVNTRYAIQEFPQDAQTALFNPALDLLAMARQRTVFSNPQAAILPAVNILAFFGGKVPVGPRVVGDVEEPVVVPPELAKHVVGLGPSQTGSVVADVITCDEIASSLEVIETADQSDVPNERIVGAGGPLANLGKVIVPMLIRLIPELLRLITPAL